MAERPLHTFQVVSTTRFAPHMVRVVLGGGGFDTFTPSDFTDSYVKFVFIHPDVDVTNLPPPLHLASLSGLPPHHRPTVRTFTVRHADPEARQLTVDFVVHGEQGVAGPWGVHGPPR